MNDDREHAINTLDAIVAAWKERVRYITDMYKICLHEDITGQVVSPTVPFGREALEKRVMASNAAP